MRNNLNAQKELYQLCHALKYYVAVKKKKGRIFCFDVERFPNYIKLKKTR